MKKAAHELALARRKVRQKGHEFMELALMMGVMTPLFIGMFQVGIGLIRANQANQVTRDINSMYIKGLDFSLTANQDLAVRLSGGLNLIRTPVNTGKGLLILSQITYIADSATAPLCKAAIDSGQACTNHGKFVFTNRIAIGNTSLPYSSIFGTPPAAIMNGDGSIYDYVTDSRAQLSTSGQAAMGNPRWQTALQEGQTVYVTESYFDPLYAGGTSVQTMAFF
jgi:hypothetical protein